MCVCVCKIPRIIELCERFRLSRGLKAFIKKIVMFGVTVSIGTEFQPDDNEESFTRSH